MSIYNVDPAPPQWELADKAATGDPATLQIQMFSTPEFECGTCGNTNPYIIGSVMVEGPEDEWDDGVFEACPECEELSHIADTLIFETD